MKDQPQPDALLAAVEALRGGVAALALPLEVTGAADARSGRQALVDQLDDYVLPRLRSLDAPLLAVVGGSTGAGKSTLVNSVLRQQVSRSGVLRPTTRSPVLVHHPDDAAAFEGDRVLASLVRLTGDEPTPEPDDDRRITAVRLATSDALPPGLALLDAPDIDSVVSANRELAAQLLAAADLWIFVTTAARYADAVPWDLLLGASARGASVAIVLDRVPPEALLEVRTHLAAMLRERGLTTSPLFTVPESAVDDDGLLDPEVVRPVRSWLVALARDSQARQVVVRRTLTGALAALRVRLSALVDAAQAQDDARAALEREADEAYVQARSKIEHGLSDGSLLRGEVLARWQEFVGTGELFRTLEAAVGRLRDRVVAALRGRPAPAEEIGEALQTGVQALLTAQAELAARDAWQRWRSVEGGRPLAESHRELASPGPALEERAARTVRDWQRYVLELVSSEGGDRRATARALSFGVNGVGVLLMLVVFSQSLGLSGAEVGIAGGTAVVAQRLLEAVFGDQAVRTLAAKAEAELLRRAGELLDADRRRFTEVLASLEQGTDVAGAAAAAARPGGRAVSRRSTASGARAGRALDVAARAQALSEALDAGGHRLDPAAARTARTLVGKVDERVRLSADHTVVALAGATGSGKSSLFNALSRLDIATVGVRRPTTSTASACVWGADGAQPLLEWLGVPRQHRVSRESALGAGDDELHGLVLLDLPDHDSTEVSHRLEVDRLVELVDVLVWVTDPQKYADAAMHRRYLARLAGHDAVVVVVLNHADRLAPKELAACVRDLERLLAADGLTGVDVVATSAATGHGVIALRQELAEAVGRRTAWRQRLAADLTSAAAELREGVADSEPEPGALARRTGLVDALVDAAGVGTVVRAVEQDYVRGATAAAGWPVTRWVGRLRPDPLRRLRVDRSQDSRAAEAELEQAVRRTSLPRPTPAQRSRVELATRRVSDGASEGLPERWADAVRSAAQPAPDDLGDALDQAVVRTDLGLRRPAWWRVLGAVQWLLALAAVVGLVWLVALAVMGWLRLPEPATPYLGPLPWPTLLLVGGLVLGALLAAVVRAVAGPASRRRGERVRRRLADAVAAVARERVLAPVEAVLADHRATREALHRVVA